MLIAGLEEANTKRKPNLEAFYHEYVERLKVYKLYIMLCILHTLSSTVVG